MNLPDLLLSYGIELRKRGNEYQCLCFAHNDHNPSMSVYINGTGKHVAHCFSCGYHGDVIDAYMTLSGVDDFKYAANAVGSGIIDTGKRHARIIDDGLPQLPKRETIMPPEDSGIPRMDYIKTRDGTPFGTPDEIYTFTQPSGEPWYYEARWNNINGKKECRVFTYGRRGAEPAKWSCSHYNDPRPIYGLDRITKYTDAQIVVCEGPRKASAAQKLIPQIVATGWTGGAEAWHKSDWTPIAEHKCILWPDADEPGRKAMAGLAQHLISLGCEVRILDTTAQPEKWDAADAIKNGWDTKKTLDWCKEVKGELVELSNDTCKLQEEGIAPEDMSAYELEAIHVVDDAQTETPKSIHVVQPLEDEYLNLSDTAWGEPVDLFSEFTAPPLQRGLLPRIVEDHVFDLAECINTDPAYGAITALSAVAGLLDDRIKIRINDGFYESARIWTMCVGEPSTKKSPIMDAILAPVGHISKNVAQEDKKIQQRQETLDARHKAKLKEYTEACIKSDDHSVPEPIPPQRLERRRVKCDNLTREALEEILRDMPSGVFLHADEISGWIGSLDAYKAAGTNSDRPLWLRAFGGGPMQVDRIGRGSYLIENWSVTLSGGIQPSKLANLAGKLDDDGLLQRFLIVTSNREGGQGAERPRNHDFAKAWATLLEHIADTKHGGGHVTMTPEAYSIMRETGAEIYKIINAQMVSRAFTTALGKWEGISARMILIYHAIECAARGVHPESAEVAPETARMAMQYMMEHLLPHMFSFYEDGIGKSEVASVTKLIAGMIVAQGDTEITTTKLKQFGPAAFRRLGERQVSVLSRLVEMHWMMPRNEATSLIRHPTKYYVNPSVHVLYARHKQDELERINSRREIGDRIKSGSPGR